MKNMKDIFDFLNGASGDGQTEETVHDRTIVIDGIRNGNLGGGGSQERILPNGSIEIFREKHLVKTCIGCIVTTDPKDDRYPYYAGECSWGHPTCSDHLKRCDQPGCDKLVCPRDSAEYRPGQFKCKKHYRFWCVKQVLKFLLYPFIRFPEEELKDEKKEGRF